MTTESLKTILDRDLSVVRGKNKIYIAKEILSEEINYATNLFGRCMKEASPTPEDDASLLALFRHVIEIADGIEVLISSCCCVPAIPLLRSLLEASLSIDYIIIDDYSKRSRSWLYFYYKDKLDLYNKLDSSTENGKDFEKAIKHDKYLKTFDLSLRQSDIKKEKLNIKAILEREVFKDIRNEIGKIVDKRKKNVKWYELYNGPSNIKELAYKVNRSGQYSFLYKLWSRFTHAQDFSQFFDKSEEEQLTIKPLRGPSEIRSVAILSSILLISSIMAILKKFRVGETEAFGLWYVENIRGNSRKLEDYK